MSNIFNMMAKSIMESHQGRIRYMSNGWVFSDKGTTNGQGVYLKPHPAKDGRMASLALKVLSATNCPQPPNGMDVPHMTHGFSVPMKFCRKCPNHIKRRRGQPFPACRVLRDMRAKGPTPLQTLTGVMQSAADKAKEMLEGK